MAAAAPAPRPTEPVEVIDTVTEDCTVCEGYGYIEVAHGIHPANVTEKRCPAECENGEVTVHAAAA